MASEVITSVKARDLGALKRALPKGTKVPAQAIVEAGRLAWTAGLEVLHDRGGDVNASFKNYRALHNLIQESPHAVSASTPDRLACLQWLLKHGADPEKVAGWPSARALVIGAFQGVPAYVGAMLEAGAALDVFTEAALGDAKAVARRLRQNPSLATARDQQVLTALHCCAGSRMRPPAARAVDVAGALIAAGADVNATARSWGGEINVAYLAIKANQIGVLTLLLQHGLLADSGMSTAAWENRPDVIDLLVQHGAAIDAIGEKEKPVLNDLIRWGQLAQARMLLSKGASPNVPDAEGSTAMHQAVSRGNVKILVELRAAGGKSDLKNHAGKTPKQLALARGRADLIAALG